VGQEGLEPSTDGLKDPWARQSIREVIPTWHRNGTVSLAQRVLVAFARRTPDAERLAIELAEAVLEEHIASETCDDAVEAMRRGA